MLIIWEPSRLVAIGNVRVLRGSSLARSCSRLEVRSFSDCFYLCLEAFHISCVSCPHFQLSTTLWLKRCLLASVLTLLTAILILSLVALVTLSVYFIRGQNKLFLFFIS